MRKLSLIASLVLLAAACAGSKHVPESEPQTSEPHSPATMISLPGAGRIIGSPPPSAVIYRTDGNFDLNVPVNLNPDGSLASYPAPADVRNAQPIPLADGFLLDRRGVGPATVFTRYTYAQYAAMHQAPPPDSILAAIIPGSRVSQSVVLPMTLQSALADTAAVNRFIRNL